MYEDGRGQPGDAAFITHKRSVDVAADGELRFPGVSTRIDPSTVQFRSLSDAKGTSVVEQRYAYDLGSPEKLMKRYLGKQVTVTTSKGEVTGTLRGLDAEALVIETGSAVEIIRRGDNLLDVKLATSAGDLATVPTLVWKEVRVALINGLALGAVLGIVVLLWFRSPALAAVIATALTLNLCFAALGGVFVPVTLKRMGFDPALAGGVILTTITDVMGFLTFLGLATLVLLR